MLALKARGGVVAHSWLGHVILSHAGGFVCHSGSDEVHSATTFWSSAGFDDVQTLYLKAAAGAAVYSGLTGDFLSYGMRGWRAVGRRDITARACVT